MELPDTSGLQLERTDFAPDGRRAVLFGLEVTNPAASARTVKVKVDAHSELLGAYPWSFSTPTASDNLADTVNFDGGALVFREQGALPHANADSHDWAALVAADRRPSSGERGSGHRGDQGDNICTFEEPPSACDDGPVGKGQGGQLRYDVRVPGQSSETLWVAVAGSDRGLAAARSELTAALQNPAEALRRKVAAREQLGNRTRVSLPGAATGNRDRLEQARPRRLHPDGRGLEGPLHRPGTAVPGTGRHRHARPLVRRRLA